MVLFPQPFSPTIAVNWLELTLKFVCESTSFAAFWYLKETSLKKIFWLNEIDVTVSRSSSLVSLLIKLIKSCPSCFARPIYCILLAYKSSIIKAYRKASRQIKHSVTVCFWLVRKFGTSPSMNTPKTTQAYSKKHSTRVRFATRDIPCQVC